MMTKRHADAIDMALIEQLYEINGPATVARLLAWRLRKPSPRREVLDMVARWLDPESNDCFKLVVARRRGGKSPTKQLNDQTIAKAILRSQQRLGWKRLSKEEVGDIADQFNISDAKVRKVISQIQKK
jgi:hypothetical protein